MSQTNRISAAEARVIALTDMLAGATRRASEEPGNIELENEVRYLDDQLEQALLSKRPARRRVMVHYEWVPTNRAGGPTLEMRETVLR